MQASRFLLGRCAAAKQISHPRDQFRQCEGLGQVVVTTLLKTSYTLVNGTTRGQNQHGRRVALGAAAGNEVQTVHVGQSQINDETVVDLLSCLYFG
jgi:hypothetical protein